MKPHKAQGTLLLTCLLSIASLSSLAQSTQLNLYRSNQPVTVTNLDHVQKITFEAGQLVIHYVDQPQTTFPLNDIQSIRFVQDPSKLTQMPVEKLVVYPNPVVNELNLANLPVGTHTVRLHGISGTLLLQRTLTEGAASLDVSHLPAGFYLLTVGAQTLRFTKQAK